GWVATVSQGKAAALAPAYHLAWRGLAVIAAACTAVVLAGLLVARRIRRSYEAVEEARERAEQATRARDEFLSVASHELRNPIAAIHGLAQLIQRRRE